jgi:uncharacterized protein involved in exopolysaccharide biosynthesis
MVRRDLNYWTELVFRRRTAFLEAAGIVFGLVVIGTMLWPPVYESTAEILVQNNRAQLLVSPDLQTESAQNPAIITNPVSEQDLNSEVELITSTPLIEQALKGLHLRPSDTASSLLHNTVGLALDLPEEGYRLLHGEAPITARDQWAIKLAHHLTAFPIKRSDIVEVSFRAHDAAWAQTFLSRLIDQYMRYHAMLSHDPQAAKFFSEQAGLLGRQLDAAEDNLRKLEVKTGITSLPDQQQALVNQLSQLQIQDAQASAKLASTRQQIAALQGELHKTPERIGTEKQSVQNLALQQIKPEVMRLESERAELLTRYQPTSRRISEIDARLAAAKKILNHENHLVVQQVSTNLNPVWVTLDQGLGQAQASASALAASHNAFTQQIQAMHKQLIAMVDNGVLIEQAQRKVASAKETYLSYLRKSEEARAAQGLNSSQILNVSLAQAPDDPIAPVLPIVWLNLLAGFALAVAVGFGVAYWEERSDPRLYSAVAVEEASGVSNIAVLHNQA